MGRRDSIADITFLILSINNNFIDRKLNFFLNLGSSDSANDPVIILFHSHRFLPTTSLNIPQNEFYENIQGVKVRGSPLIAGLYLKHDFFKL